MRILLTGATGFVGSRLLRSLTASGHDVVCLGRRAAEDSSAVNWRLEKPGDLRASDAPGGPAFDRVYHLAAAGVDPSDRDADRLIDVNIKFGVKLLQEIDANVFVFAGSSAEYAEKESDAYKESDPLQQTDLYGASKAAGGVMHLAMARAARKPLAHLRLFHVYGPGEKPHRLTTSLFGSLKQGVRVALSPGEQIRDLVHVDDAVAAFGAAGQGLQSGALSTGAYNIASGEGVKIKDVCRQIAALIGADESLLGFGDIPMRANELACVVGDASAMKKAVGWRPALSLEDGLRKLKEELSVGGKGEA